MPVKHNESRKGQWSREYKAWTEMSKPNIVCVVPSIRPEQMVGFLKAWQPLFDKHDVHLLVVWDGENPTIECGRTGNKYHPFDTEPFKSHRELFCRFSDCCRNLGFVVAAQLKPDYILTMDDDVTAVPTYSDGSLRLGDTNDSIQAHIDALNRRVPLSWMNTAHDTDLYLRGVPYGVRDEAPVMLSHGVWVGTPDFDGETQLRLEQGSGVPYSLPYYVGPMPRGVLFPLSGMNVMVRAAALPHLYFAPMGLDSGVNFVTAVDPNDPHKGNHWASLHRFADIFMGVYLKRKFDELGWGCVTGYSTILHTRASDARKNYEQEKLGREWMERINETFDGLRYLRPDNPFYVYFSTYRKKRERYAALIESILGESKV